MSVGFKREALSLAKKLYASPAFVETSDTLQLTDGNQIVRAWLRRFSIGYPWEEVCKHLLVDICAVYRKAIEQSSAAPAKGVYLVRRANLENASLEPVGVLLRHATEEEIFWSSHEEYAWINATKSLLGKGHPALVNGVTKMAAVFQETCSVELDVVNGALQWTFSSKRPSDAPPRLLVEASTAEEAYEKAEIAYRARINAKILELKECLSERT